MSSLTSSKLNQIRVASLRPKRMGRIHTVIVPRAFALNDVGSYLAKAAEHIFHPMNESDVPWSRSSESFSGSISHHEDIKRVTTLYEVVKGTRKSLESAPAAEAAPAAPVEAHTYKFDNQGELVTVEGTVGHYVKKTIERVFDNNFKGDENEPKAYFSSGYPVSSGRRSQRDLQRDVDKLRRFESVLKKTIETAENKAA